MPYEVYIKDKEQKRHEVIQDLKELKKLIELIKNKDYEIRVKQVKVLKKEK